MIVSSSAGRNLSLVLEDLGLFPEAGVYLHKYMHEYPH